MFMLRKHEIEYMPVEDELPTSGILATTSDQRYGIEWWKTKYLLMRIWLRGDMMESSCLFKLACGLL